MAFVASDPTPAHGYASRSVSDPFDPPRCSAIVGGAGLLFLTNLVAIVSSAFIVFLLVHMDGGEVRAEIDRIRDERAERSLLHHAIRQSGLGRRLAGGSRLSWRILMIVILLGAVAVPLQHALEEVKNEIVARSSVQDAVRRLAPPGALVSHQVSMSPKEIAINVISTESIDADRIRQTRASLVQRTGRNVRIAVQEVASKSELQKLLERMSAAAAPAAAPAPPPNIAELRSQALDLIRPQLESTWPGSDLPLLGYELAFTGDRSVLRIEYQAAREIQPEALSVLESVLRKELNTPDLALEVRRQPPPRPARAKRPASPTR